MGFHYSYKFILRYFPFSILLTFVFHRSNNIRSMMIDPWLFVGGVLGGDKEGLFPKYSIYYGVGSIFNLSFFDQT